MREKAKGFVSYVEVSVIPVDHDSKGLTKCTAFYSHRRTMIRILDGAVVTES